MIFVNSHNSSLKSSAKNERPPGSHEYLQHICKAVVITSLRLCIGSIDALLVNEPLLISRCSDFDGFTFL